MKINCKKAEKVVSTMKIAQLMTSTSADLESRKRAIQRKEMGEAYKKTAQYQSPKNPLLEVLEDLLSGKADKDLHAADQAQRELEDQGNEHKTNALTTKEEKLERPEVKVEVRKLEMTEKEVIAHEQAHKSVGGDVTGPISYTYATGPDDKRYINGGEVSIQVGEGSTPEETIQILEKVRAAALAPAQPSPQDLRVAASAASQIQQTQVEIARDDYADSLENENPFENVDTGVEVPDRFLSNFDERDANEDTLFGQELESLLFQRMFDKAATRYASHVAMVKNGYRPLGEPIFSQIA